MIQCEKCKSMHESQQTRCSQCGADLLPELSTRERLSFLGKALWYLLISIIVSLVIMAIFSTSSEGPSGLPPVGKLIGSVIFISGVCIFFRYLGLAIVRTPMHMRYANRAKRHEGLNNELAESDWGKAIQLAPKRGDYRYKRGLFYEKVGMLERAHMDFRSASKLEMEDVPRAEIDEALQRTIAKELPKPLIKCKACGNDISASAVACPSCGSPVQTEPSVAHSGGGATCPHCGSQNVSKVEGLKGFGESFACVCLIMLGFIPGLVYYWYMTTVPFCSDCGRRVRR